MNAAVAGAVLGPQWTVVACPRPGVLRWRRSEGLNLDVEVERCAAGPLRDAYPVSAHDIAVQVFGRPAADVLTDVLVSVVDAVLTSDPRCRRVVYAARAGDHDAVWAAEAAGFRYVLDVDVPGAELSLLVAEPAWVSRVDIDLDHVPGT